MNLLKALASPMNGDVPVPEFVNQNPAQAGKPPEDEIRQRKLALAHVARLSAIGEMLTEIAHEISQPLFAIQNFANACTIGIADDKPIQREKLINWIRQIAALAERARIIIDRLQNFTRKSPHCPAQLDVPEVVQEAVALVLPEVHSRSIEIDMQFDEDGRSVFGDRIQIQQVMVNLLRNAYEAIDVPGVVMRRITVRTCREQETVHFSVADTGCGLPAVDPEKLFDPFFTTKPDGVGIGLTISRSIIEAVKGRLWAETTGGAGSVFHFQIPVSHQGQDDDA